MSTNVPSSSSSSSSSPSSESHQPYDPHAFRKAYIPPHARLNAQALSFSPSPGAPSASSSASAGGDERPSGGPFGSRDVRAGDFVTRSSSHDFRVSSASSSSSGNVSARFAFGKPSSSSRRSNVERDERLELELFGDVSTKPMAIDFKNYEDIPVETSGLDVPSPIDAFHQLECPDVLQTCITLSGYTKPTPVQRYSIPIAMAGRDLMSCAQTGSGKTAAFLLPLVATILKHELHLRPSPDQRQSFGRTRRAFPSALVLAPTRELATQIHNECRKFVYRSGLYPVVVYGGAEIRNQIREIERGCDILVATPGRLVDFLQRGRISLAHIEFLVFDEADRMLDMGFEPQIRSIVGDNDMPHETRQTLMFSATFPKEIQRLAQDFLRNYVFLAVGRVGSTTEYITQKVELAAMYESEKIVRLMQILATCEGLTLIFVETKRGADALENALYREGIQATSIHGDRSQAEREDALAMFRCGRCPVLVATDVASRGLDIPQVRCVINFDLPSNIDDYVHRIGRTGRAGQKGTAVAFVAEKNRPILRDLFDLLKENNQHIPPWFDEMLHSSSGGFGISRAPRGGRGRGRGGPSFGSRDYRNDVGSGHGRPANGNTMSSPPARVGMGANQFGHNSRQRGYFGGSSTDSW